jgi:hypothetical protein
MELVLSLLFATHTPYHWEMDCERWQTRAVEILNDDNLPMSERRFLIRYLRNKVVGECEFDWTQVSQED